MARVFLWRPGPCFVLKRRHVCWTRGRGRDCQICLLGGAQAALSTSSRTCLPRMSLRGVFKALGSTSAQTQVAAARRLAADPSVTDAAQAVKVLGALVDAAGACDAKAVPWLVKVSALRS